jgi:hypothetical protein
MLESFGPAAFPAGTHVYYNHLGESEEYDRGGVHDVRDLIGVLESDAEYLPAEEALYSDVQWLPHAVEFVKNVYPYVGLSVEARGVKNSEGIVESLIPSPINAVALVPRAGRDGAITEFYESYQEKAGYDKLLENASLEEDGKDDGMKPEEIEALTTALKEALTGALAAGFTELKESLAVKPEVEPAGEGDDKDTPADAGAIAEALVAADLPKASREKVLKAVADGEKVEEAIRAEKDYIAEVLKENAVDTSGRILGSNADNFDFTVGGWGN